MSTSTSSNFNDLLLTVKTRKFFVTLRGVCDVPSGDGVFCIDGFLNQLVTSCLAVTLEIISIRKLVRIFHVVNQ